MSGERKRNSTRCRVWLVDAGENFCPPQEHVLGVEVIGDVLSLEIASYSETGASESYETVASVVVDFQTFLKAIIASTDKDTLLWTVQLPTALQRELIEWIRSRGGPQ